MNKPSNPNVLECHPGDKVKVRLWNGREVIGECKAVWESVSGRKVRVHSGDMVLTIEAEQVISIISSI